MAAVINEESIHSSEVTVFAIDLVSVTIYMGFLISLKFSQHAGDFSVLVSLAAELGISSASWEQTFKS